MLRIRRTEIFIALGQTVEWKKRETAREINRVLIDGKKWKFLY